MKSHSKKSGRPGGLMLNRRVGEVISVEHGLLEIEITRIQKNQVQLRFLGHVRVDRKENLTTEEPEQEAPKVTHDDSADRLILGAEASLSGGLRTRF